MRLIDADKVRGKAVPHTRGEFGTYNADIRKWAVLVGDIDDAPTVDAVEVVRCKDCTFYRPLNSQGEKEWGTCKKINVPSTYPNEFCSRGERRTDGSDA